MIVEQVYARALRFFFRELEAPARDWFLNLDSTPESATTEDFDRWLVDASDVEARCFADLLDRSRQSQFWRLRISARVVRSMTEEQLRSLSRPLSEHDRTLLQEALALRPWKEP